jgi:eukaryotic-like serine/threonine-protein kinase
MSLPSGTKLGPYEIKAPLGAGGMGEVYRAHDARLDRDVAIKILPTECSADPERVHRFEQEARATATLSHPNIVVVYDVGTRADGLYVVTELLEGETLRHRFGGGAITTRKVIEYASQIASGLAAAHEKGIIHRDLKPDNIFLTRDGRVKILDFGLAKLALPIKPDDRTLASEAVRTEAGMVLGTLGYMSPEQLRGEAVDHRSDLFSFGAILYEMISGQRAFRGNTSADTISAILKEDPRELSTTGGEVSPALDRLVRHCLEKSPEERFQSARDLAFDLQNLSGSTSQLAATNIPKQPRHPPLGIAGAVVLILVGLGVAFAGGWMLKSTSSPSYKQLSFQRGTINSARFAPDGQTVVYSAAWAGKLHPDLFSTRIDGVMSRPLDVNDADLLAISRQGELALLREWRRIFGWERQGILSRMPLSGGAPRELLEGVESADWSRDGSQLAVIRSQPRYQLEFPIGHMLWTANSGWLSDVRISADQQHVAFVEHPFAGDNRGNVCLLDLDGHKAVLSTGWNALRGLAWSASGKEIWFTGSNTGGILSLYGVSPSGNVRRILTVPGSLEIFDVADDGRVLLAQHDLRRMVMGLTPGNSREHDLAWLDWSITRGLTPDGRWFLFDEQAEGGGQNYSIYVRKTDGSPAFRIGDNDASAISDDGKWVIATTNAAGGSLVLLPTGAGQPRSVNIGNLRDPVALFLPDGHRILLIDSEFRAYVESLESDTPHPITPAGVVSLGIFTADGKYVLGRDAQKKWALYPIDGGQAIPLSRWPQGDEPINHATDNHSFFTRNGELPVSIFRYDFVTGSRQLVRQLRPDDTTGMDSLAEVLITPDGKYYVYGGRRTVSTLFMVSGLK